MTCAISDDAVPGDKAAFVRPSVGTPAHAVILLAFDAAALDYFLAEARR